MIETNPLAFVQGTQEWLTFRKSKITATDATVIMGVSKYKDIKQLYIEKTTDIPWQKPTKHMQRGNDLEPLARELFSIKTGILVEPVVIISKKHPWMMASLDGLSTDNIIVEIKCPGNIDHNIALNGKVPKHYYPQIQHQMSVCDAEIAYYFSFDGIDGVDILVKRDDEYIEQMILEEKKFYKSINDRIMPE
jgi:putative phage-type endonuclease